MPSQRQDVTPSQNDSTPFQETLNHDRWLMTRLLAGDPQAGEQFEARFRRLIWKLILRSGVSLAEGEDLYQQVFLHLWEQDCRRLRQWSGKGKLSSYLSRIVIRLLYDYQRAPQHTLENTLLEVTLEEGETGLSMEELCFQGQQREALRLALQQCSPRDAALLIGRHLYGKSYKELAAAWNLQVNNVGITLARAEKRLATLLRQQQPELFC